MSLCSYEVLYWMNGVASYSIKLLWFNSLMHRLYIYDITILVIHYDLSDWIVKSCLKVTLRKMRRNFGDFV